MNNTYSVFGTILVCLLSPFACGEKSDRMFVSDDSNTLDVNIKLGKLAVASITSAEIIITGSGMAEVREDLTISGGIMGGTVRGIPAGENRKFQINAYDVSGTVSYSGEAIADVVAGSLVTVSISLSAVGTQVSSVVLTIRSPMVVNYHYTHLKDYADISGEIENSSNETLSDVSIQLTTRNSTGGAMGQKTIILPSVPPGFTFFIVYFWDGPVYAKETAPINKIDYVITHSLGGPDTGSVGVSAN
jgi:hypothetical protein